jgi:hypothetical protein
VTDTPTPPTILVTLDTTELDAAVASFHAQMDGVEAELADLDERLRGITLPEPPDLTALREQVENIDAALADANGRIEDVNGLAQATSQRLDSTIERVNTNAETAIAGIEDVETKLDDASQRLIELKATVDSLVSTLAAMGTATGNRLEAIEARLTRLEGVTPPPITRPDPFSRPFADASPWNTPVPAGAQYVMPLTPGGANLDLATSGGGTPWITVKAGPTVYDVAGTVPAWTFTDRPRGKTYSIRVPSNFAVSQSTDLHAAVVNDDTVWSLFQVTNINPTARTADVGLAVPCSLTGSGWGSGTTKAGVRACGSSDLGGNISGKTLAAGRVPHALALLHNGSVLAHPPVTPANSEDSWALNPAPDGYRGRQDAFGCHQGTRMAIPTSTPMPTGLKPEQITVWRALVEFGAFWTDATGAFAMYADATVNATQEANLNSGTFLRDVARALRIVA